MIEQLSSPYKAKRAPHAIILKDRATGYISYDFAMPGDGVWHAFNHGTITGVTKKVIWATPMPMSEEDIHEPPADGKNCKVDEGKGSKGA